MMRYAAVAAVLAIFLIFFGPSLMAYGRNMARQLKSSWREQEQETELDEVSPPTDAKQETVEGANGVDDD